MLRIVGITVYPIKGLAGVSVSRWPVEARGLRHDRRWMLIDESGGFLSQRTNPILCRFRPCVDGDSLTVFAPDGSSLDVSLVRSGAAPVTVTVWKDQCQALLVGAEADEWFSSHLGTFARLVYMPEEEIRPTNPEFSQPGDHVGFADAFPVLVASLGSLEDLNERLDVPLPMNRFRANIVVDGCGPFEEDTWPSFEVSGLYFRAAKRCARCQVTATNQDTGEVGQEPLRALAKFRLADGKVYFGAYFIPEASGFLAVGDPLEAMSLLDKSAFVAETPLG